MDAVYKRVMYVNAHQKPVTSTTGLSLFPCFILVLNGFKGQRKKTVAHKIHLRRINSSYSNLRRMTKFHKKINLNN